MRNLLIICGTGRCRKKKIRAPRLLLAMSCCAFLFLQKSAYGQSRQSAFFDTWKLEAGPVFSLPQWSFKMWNSAGIGADAALTRPFPGVDNLYVGGRLHYVYFFAKNNPDLIFSSGRPFHMIGVMADAHYVFHEKYVGGGNLGIGIPTIAFDGIGLARSVYVGYRLSVGNKLLIPALFINRTTFATWNIGLRGTISI